MNTLFNFSRIILLLSIFVFFSCGQVTRLYDGPVKKKSEIAYIKATSASSKNKTTIIHSIDGKYGPYYCVGNKVFNDNNHKLKLELLPGEYTFEVSYGAITPTEIKLNVIKGGKYKIIPDKQKRDCIKIINTSNPNEFFEGCNTKTNKISIDTNTCVTLFYDGSLPKDFIFGTPMLFKIDGQWGPWARFGGYTYNSAFDGSFEVKLNPGIHKLEFNYYRVGLNTFYYSEEPIKKEFQFEANKKYTIQCLSDGEKLLINIVESDHK